MPAKAWRNSGKPFNTTATEEANATAKADACHGLASLFMLGEFFQSVQGDASMNRRITHIVTVAATLLAVAGCGQAPPGDAAANLDTETAEYAAMEYRHGLMHVIAFKAGKVRGMADGEIPVDEAVFVQSAIDLAAAAKMLDDAFPEGTDSVSLPGASNALPEIWSDWDAFVERRTALQTVSQTVAAQAQAGGFAAAQTAAAEQIGPSCGGCHRPYRQRED